MPATATGRGAQVILDGDAQKAARGAYAPTYVGNAARLADLQRTGAVADGAATQDGTTRSGMPASDYLLGDTSIGDNAGIRVASVNTQPTADYTYNEFASTVSYTANGTNGDSLGLVSYMYVNANGFSVPNTASQHTSAIYGNGALVSAGTVYQVNGIMGVSGNAGSGILTNGIDFFGHANYKTGGGTITNHYFLFQEGSSGATNEYGAFLSAPSGIGTTAPTYNLHIDCSVGGNIRSDNGFAVGFGGGNGSFLVKSTGTSIYPAFELGVAGGFGCTELIVGNNGAAEATNSTRSFLYITSCAGPPTGVPIQAAIGRCAMRYDTTNNKLWMHNGTSWRGVLLT
jgi:hypothetical protein